MTFKQFAVTRRIPYQFAVACLLSYEVNDLSILTKDQVTNRNIAESAFKLLIGDEERLEQFIAYTNHHLTLAKEEWAYG